MLYMCVCVHIYKIKAHIFDIHFGIELWVTYEAMTTISKGEK